LYESELMPSVTVIIPAYNVSKFIAETLESVFAQTFHDFDVVVVNDGSTDTEELERVLDPYLGRIHYVKQANGGPAAARNTGLRFATGEFVHFLDSDDTVLPEFLGSQIELLHSRPDIDLASADGRCFGDAAFNGMRLSDCNSRREPVTLENLITHQSQLFASGVVARRDKIVAADCFDPQVRGVEDFDLWLRMARAGARIVYNSRPLFRYRLRPGSLSRDKSAMFETLSLVLRKFAATLDPTDPLRAVISRQILRDDAERELFLARSSLERHEIQEARRHYRRACQLDFKTTTFVMAIGLRIAPGVTIRLRRLRSAILSG
jgi:glycosyltransferase involved in cell wall biosynthesis